MAGLPEWAYLAVASVTGVLAVARATRLVVDDEYPPMLWVRMRWRGLVGNSGWDKLVDCAFCAAPYLAAGDLAWAVLADLHWAWWLANGWAAASYLAAMVVVRDTPE